MSVRITNLTEEAFSHQQAALSHIFAAKGATDAKEKKDSDSGSCDLFALISLRPLRLLRLNSRVTALAEC
jgi:hypothetical protein